MQDVIKNKSLLFPSAWANYPLIETEGLKLLPSSDRLLDLKSDYVHTREELVYGADKPSFEDLLTDMAMLEERLKTL